MRKVFTSHQTCKRKCAFTLAEVLITLGIIGVVAAITLPSLITSIQNKGYVEHLNKTYSVLQNVTNLIVNEEGPPSNWILSSYIIGSHEPNKVVAQYYVDRMKVAKYCGFLQNNYRDESCVVTLNNYDLNGDKATYNSGMFLYDFAYPILLQDGSSVALKFRDNTDGGVYWGYPDITFIVDVNGKKKPNKVGRDIFFLYLNAKDNGKIYPFIKERFTSDTPTKFIDDCKSGGSGYSCAYRVITEGKMNY